MFPEVKAYQRSSLEHIHSESPTAQVEASIVIIATSMYIEIDRGANWTLKFDAEKYPWEVIYRWSTMTVENVSSSCKQLEVSELPE